MTNSIANSTATATTTFQYLKNGAGSTAVSATEAIKKAPLPEKALGPDGKIDWKHISPDINHEGTKIVLPDDPDKMPIDDAITALQQKKADEEQVMAVNEIVDAYPLDGAVAFMIALKARYGWASPIPTPGFFGPEPPRMITVDVGPHPDEKIQIPWGRFKVPGIEMPVSTDVARTPRGPAFSIVGKLRKKEVHVIKELADLTREIVKQHSIYRGKAIRLATNDDGELEFHVPPTFIGTDHVKPNELILSDLTGKLIETNVFTLIRRTDACVKAGIPLKRGVLLHGPYGGGKSMTALVTAKYAVDNGWTYIMLDKAQALTHAIEFAKRYEPCVIFAEDIDRITEDRDEQANDLLNTIDGILSKDSKTMVVMTTNHVEKITPAMLRPGRLDAIIAVTPPDSIAAQKLVRLYARGLIASDVSIEKLGDILDGWMPAVIREVVERSKLGMVSRGDEELVEEDFIAAALTMDAHRKLLEKPVDQNPSAEERLGLALGEILKNTSKPLLNQLESDVNDNTDDDGSSTRCTVIDTASNLESGLHAVKKDLDAIKKKFSVVTPD